jgi:hypothetical protein
MAILIITIEYYIKNQISKIKYQKSKIKSKIKIVRSRDIRVDRIIKQFEHDIILFDRI